jgi:hypothetical protein
MKDIIKLIEKMLSEVFPMPENHKQAVYGYIPNPSRNSRLELLRNAKRRPLR